MPKELTFCRRTIVVNEKTVQYNSLRKIFQEEAEKGVNSFLLFSCRLMLHYVFLHSVLALECIKMPLCG